MDRVAHLDPFPLKSPRHVAIVGAGWSGLACALTLVDRGVRSTVIDAAPQPGGRARRVAITFGDTNHALDNGQHLLLGAYRETLRLIERVGLDAKRLLLRQPFALHHADGFALRTRNLPAPWHLASALLTARGLALTDRMSLAREVLAWKRAGWLTRPDASALATISHSTPASVRRVWQPLCLAALNVPLEGASGQMFLNVLRDSLGDAADASDLLLPRADLSALLPDAAVRVLQQAGSALLLRQPALALRPRTGGWTLALRERVIDADAVVLALAPWHAADLLASAEDRKLAPDVDRLRHIDAAPIATLYLRFAPPTRLRAPALLLAADAAQRRFAQWIFDRGALDPGCAGVMTVVVSGAGPHLDLQRDAFVHAVVRQVTDELALPPPLAHRLIVEKRATIVPRPALARPPSRLPAPGLFLAGDAADSPYPSTLEGSVRAGIAAACAVLSV